MPFSVFPKKKTCSTRAAHCRTEVAAAPKYKNSQATCSCHAAAHSRRVQIKVRSECGNQKGGLQDIHRRTEFVAGI